MRQIRYREDADKRGFLCSIFHLNFEIMELLHEELTDVIIKTFYEVYNELGYGFLERVYLNSLYLELNSKGLKLKHRRKLLCIIKELK